MNLLTRVGISVILILFFLGCASTKKHWKEASTNSTIEAYEEFLAIHPESEFITDANYRIEELYYKQSKTKNTVVDYTEYIKRYPDGRFANDARSRIETLYFEKANSANIIESYRNFLSKYPKSKYSQEIYGRIENLRYSKIKNSKNIDNLRAFLNEFHKGKYSNEIDERIDALEKIKAEKLAQNINVKTLGKWGDTPLHEAALDGNYYLAEALLKKGANVNARIRRTGITPLHAAAKNGNTKLAKLLLDNGANVNAKTKLDTMPINFTKRNDMILFLKNHGGRKLGMTWVERNVPPVPDSLRHCYCLSLDPYDNKWRCCSDDDPYI